MCFFFHLLLLFSGSCGTTGFPVPPPSSATENTTLEYVDPTLPPLLPGQNPKCSLSVLRHDFANTVGLPPISVKYTPPAGCHPPWSRVILELSGTASNVQKDRIAAIWIDGAEVLRTSAPYSMAPGVFWRVRKDVTRYTALLRGSAEEDTTFSMMLENSNDTFSGVFSVNVSLHFYRGALCQVRQNCDKDATNSGPATNPVYLGGGASPKLSSHPTIKGLYHEPADLIIPISNELGDCGHGYWFKVQNESDAQFSTIQIPQNTYRIVLEIYVSGHEDDEYWYSNPLRSTGLSASASASASASSKANGGFRQAIVTIDKKYSGGIVPFPVIYPGSVNPFFWAPVTGIGAFDHPSYDIDLSPFIGNLVDGREHDFGLTVRESQSYWLVTGNLHLWLDPWSDVVEAALVRYKVPPLRLSKQADWRNGVGKSSVDAQVIERFAGWVSSSKGNITTAIRQRLKFKSRVEMQAKGSIKQVEMDVKQRTNVRTEKNHAVVGRVSISTEAPLYIQTIRSNGGGGSEFEKTKMSHSLQQITNVAMKKEAPVLSMLEDRQDSEGSVLMENGRAMWGSGDTKSTYKYRDNKACYLRSLIMVGGKLKDDVQSASCVSVVDSY